MRDYKIRSDSHTGSRTTTGRVLRQLPEEQHHVESTSRRSKETLLSALAAAILGSILLMVSNKWTIRYVHHIRGRNMLATFELAEEIFGEAAGDHFGSSIAIAGRRFVVGAARANNVRVYDQTAISVDQVGPGINGSLDEYFGGAVTISGDGRRLAAAASSSDESSLDSGEVRIYEWESGMQVWNKTATISADVEFGTEDARSGFALAMSNDGDKLVVSSPYNRANGSYAGSVGTYINSRGSWVEIGSRLDGKGTNSFFGYSLAMTPDGKCLVVGEPMRDNGSADNVAGYTNIYKWQNGTWAHKGQPLVGLTNNARSGFSVAISNDCARVVSGAPCSDVGGQDTGRVRIYDYNVGTSNWVQDSTLDGAAHDLYGTSVALSSDGTRLAVGAVQSAPIGDPNLSDPNGAHPGYVKVYDWTPAGWEQFGSAVTGVGSFDQLGYKIALSHRGDRLVISNLLRDDGPGKTDSGSVRVFSLTPKNLLCPTSNVELVTSVCKGQEPHNDGALCSSCVLTADCIGGGVTTYCTGERKGVVASFCMPLEQVESGCRCQRKRDCYGHEDRVNACRELLSNFPYPFGSLFAYARSKYCVPYGVI